MKNETIRALVAAAAVAVAGAAWADKAFDNDTGLTWTYRVLEDGTAEICDYDSEIFSYNAPAVDPEPEGALEIPETLDGRTVTRVGENALSNCGNITSVTIPSSVKSIGKAAFWNCWKMKSVTMPGVKEIDEIAFQSCRSLSSVTMPDDVTILESGVFGGCPSLADETDEFVIINGVIYGRASREGVFPKDVVIPATVTRIANFAFAGQWDGVMSVTIPGNVKSIGDYAFSGCDLGEGVVIQNGVQSIGVSAFYRSNVKSVVIPGSVKSIGESAFTYTDLTSVWLNSGVETLDASAFRADGLKRATIPYTVTTVESAGIFSGVETIYVEAGDTARVKEMLPFTDSDLAAIDFVEPSGAYAVTLDANGGICGAASVMVKKDAAAGDLPVPIRVGYTFDGWYTAKTDGTKVDETTTVSGSATYYAHWTPQSYTLWFWPNGGDVTPSEMEVTYDSAYGTLPVPTPFDGALEFDGWYTANDGGTKVTAATTVSIAKDHYLYAHWKDSSVTKYTVTFDVNGGDSVSESSRTVAAGAEVGTLPTASRSGYTLEGWYTGPASGVKISTSDPVYGDVTYYAHWAEDAPPTPPANDMFANATTISGVSGSVSGSNVDATLETDEPLPKFGDCQRSVWWTWTAPKSGTVTFDTIGSTFDTMMGVYTGNAVASLTAIAENDDDPGDRSRVSFTAVAGTTYRIAVAGYQTNAGDITLNWSFSDAMTYTVTFDVNGGDSVSESSRTVAAGAEVGTLPTASRSGYTFEGWYTLPVGGYPIYPSTTVTGDATYYARWGGGLAIETTVIDGVTWSYFVSGNKVMLYNNLSSVIPGDYEGALVIPSKIAGKTVAGIGERAFYGCTGLTSVIIPDGVEEINVAAFAWCDGLQVVQFGKGVSKGTIFFDAFKGCARLRALDFKGTTPPTVANYSAFEDAGTMTLEGKPIVYVPKSAAKKWGCEWTGMRVMPYSYSANIVMSVRPGKESRGGITPVDSGKATEVGKKVTLKAKANSGNVFAGWYDLDTGLRVSRSASYAYLVTGEDKRFEADFVDTATDIKSLGIDVGNVKTADDGSAFIDIGAAVSSCSEPKITVKGLPSGLKYDSKTQTIAGQAKKPGVYTVTVSASNASQKKAQTAEFELVVPNFTCAAMPYLLQRADAYGTIWCGVAFDSELVDCTPKSGWTVKASGLPTGLKWTDKVVVDKKTGAIVAKANTIYGVPTKAGNYTVTFTATSGREKQVATITLKISALPAWAVGTFYGGSDLFGARFGDAAACQATLTVAANGKISGKFLVGGMTWTISAASFDEGYIDEYIATVTAKSGSVVRSARIALESSGSAILGGNATVSGDFGGLALYQANWKADPLKSIAKGKAFANAAKSEVSYDRSDAWEARTAKLSLKFATSGAVTVKGEFNIGGVAYKGSASATLVPLFEPSGTGAFTGEVCAYIPAKAGKFGGYFERLTVKWDGTSFSLVE